jgi:hypothetical protein
MAIVISLLVLLLIVVLLLQRWKVMPSVTSGGIGCRRCVSWRTLFAGMVLRNAFVLKKKKGEKGRLHDKH